MSTDPIPANISATYACHSDQVSLECPAEITIECNGFSVMVKPTLDAQETQAAFRFLYEIYVEKEKLISPDKLPPECVASRSRWDKWDSRPSTRHIVAMVGEEVVGHLRLLYVRTDRCHWKKTVTAFPQMQGKNVN